WRRVVGKLVVLKLGDGSFEQGFSVTLQIGDESARPSTEVTGVLPANAEILQIYQQWQLAYRQLGLRSRLSAPSGQITNVSMVADCNRAAQILRDSLNHWLSTERFRIIREKLLEKLSPADEIRMVLQTKDLQLQRLPWHLWDFFERYPKAEAALSAPIYEQPGQVRQSSNRVKILAILGNSNGIDVQADRSLLEQLSGAEVNFVVEPTRRELSDQFWRQSWDILFFAGHSSTQIDTETGWIEINATERLTIAQLKYALRKGVERGLRVAIFNSCDGLGLAQNLSDLRIPQIIVMRDPVPDQIAQEFLKNFLEAYAQGESFYLSVREARERLEGLEDIFPCATWLPIIFQNPAEVPPSWEDLCGGRVTTSFLFGATETAEAAGRSHPATLPRPSASPLKAVSSDAIPKAADPRVTSPAPASEPDMLSIPLPEPIPEPLPGGPSVQPEAATPALDPLFLEQCQRELSRHVGPISQFLLKDVLSHHAQISAQQLIDILATKIPNLQQAETFKHQIEMVAPQPQARSSPEPQRISSRNRASEFPVEQNQPKPLTVLEPAFLERCRQELARYIGPIASHILKTALKQHPHPTPQQLVEILAANIPHPQQAEEFRRNLS
ncbi:MAG: CHAT domain-containing protein, partial [Kovacikia sp.]